MCTGRGKSPSRYGVSVACHLVSTVPSFLGGHHIERLCSGENRLWHLKVRVSRYTVGSLLTENSQRDTSRVSGPVIAQNEVRFGVVAGSFG